MTCQNYLIATNWNQVYQDILPSTSNLQRAMTRMAMALKTQISNKRESNNAHITFSIVSHNLLVLRTCQQLGT